MILPASRETPTRLCRFLMATGPNPKLNRGQAGSAPQTEATEMAACREVPSISPSRTFMHRLLFCRCLSIFLLTRQPPHSASAKYACF